MKAFVLKNIDQNSKRYGKYYLGGLSWGNLDSAFTYHQADDIQTGEKEIVVPIEVIIREIDNG